MCCVYFGLLRLRRFLCYFDWLGVVAFTSPVVVHSLLAKLRKTGCACYHEPDRSRQIFRDDWLAVQASRSRGTEIISISEHTTQSTRREKLIETERRSERVQNQSATLSFGLDMWMLVSGPDIWSGARKIVHCAGLLPGVSHPLRILF